MDDTFTEDRVELLFPPILEILKSQPGGIREYELMQKLGEEGILSGTRGADTPHGACRPREDSDGGTTGGDLELFRSHFFLFHVLYRLRERLRRDGQGDLSVFCLDIRLVPRAEDPQGLLPAEHDPVAVYYLDLKNMEGVSEEDVRRMIGGFFDRLEAYYRREEDLALLGLPPEATPEEIRRRYRSLAFEYHPDAGGDEESFRSLRDAAERLRKAGRI